MTYAPVCVKGARTYLISRGLDPASIGIVGDQDHHDDGGYHCGNDWLADIGNLYDDYSKRESSRDRPGSDAAMALDVGGLSDDALWALSSWIVSQCQAGFLWTADIREVIYWHKPTNTIRRWDRLGIRTTGGSNHRTHTHISYHRDSEGRDKAELFMRYYEPQRFASAPTPAPEEDEDMKPIVVFHAAAPGRPAEWAVLVPGVKPVVSTDQWHGTLWVSRYYSPTSSADQPYTLASYDALVAAYAAAAA